MTAGWRLVLNVTALGIAIDSDGPLCGILLSGSPASGKSTNAAALIHHCPYGRTRLIGDDAVFIQEKSAPPLLRAPKRLQGVLEIRHCHLIRVAHTPDILRFCAEFTCFAQIETNNRPSSVGKAAFSDFCPAARIPLYRVCSTHAAPLLIRTLLKNRPPV